jgi:hypothetical protein
MIGFILILFAHVGPMGSGNSNALTVTTPFASKAGCTAAGEAAKNLASGTLKEIRYVCVETK